MHWSYHILYIIAFTVNFGIIYESNVNNANLIKENNKLVSRELNSIYKLAESQNSKLYTIMDTQVLTFHYVKPHEEPVLYCPECARIKGSSKTEDKEKSQNTKSNIRYVIPDNKLNPQCLRRGCWSRY